MHCPKQTELIQISADGSRRRIQRCGEQRAETFGANVSSDVCEACPIRELVTREAKQRAAPKTKYTDTHTVRSVRQDKSPPSRWLSCRFRKVVLTTACCGNPQLVRVCDCVQSTFHAQKIDAINCKGCSFREPFTETPNP